MKPWIKWTSAALAVAVLAGVGLRLAASNKAKKTTLEAQQAALQVPVRLELAPGDLIQARTLDLTRSLPVSGPIKAVNSAFVKARVAGELQGLTVREGDSVKVGQEVARIDPTEARARLRQAQQQADAAKSQVDINQRQYTNNRALVDQGFISATALVTSQASLESAQSSHQAAMAAADVARKALEDTVLKSPISGLVAQRLAQPGERVAVDARIIEVVDLSRLELEALLNPAESVAVQVGQKAQLTIEGMPAPVPATVVRINPSAQAGSRTVPVYLRVEQAPGATPLRQGLFVQGTLDTGRADVLAVPLDAVRTDKPAPYLQTLKDGRVVYAPVKTGTRAVVGGQTLVAVEGVPEGTVVIAGRIGLLREGTAVAVAASAATAAAAPALAAASRAAP